MNVRTRGVFAPKILIPLLAAGAIGIGAVSVMSLLARRGEAGISLIPADAIMALSFDNTPSAGQVALFNEIKNAMGDSGLNQLVDDFLLGLDPKTGAFKQLRSHVKGSFAVGVWGDINGGQPNVMIAVALNDADGAEGIVSQLTHGVRTSDSLRYYVPENAKGMIITFYGDYAIFAANIETAKKALDVAKGTVPNLYEQASFKQARQSLPADASLMFFVNGEAVSKADKNTRQLYEAMGVHPEGWMAVGMTLRSEGIQFDMFEPESYHGAFKEVLRNLKPLHYSSLEKFPNGAIGVVGLSSPAVYAQIFEKVFENMPKVGPEVEKGISEMEKETGTSFHNDWIPALRGEVYAALYPPIPGEKNPGVIFSIDSSNGGTPVNLFETLVEKANSGQFDKGGKKVRFTKSQHGDMQVFVPSDSKGDAFLAENGDQLMLFSKEALLERSASGNGSLADSDNLSSFTQGQPAQFRLQLDMYGLVDMISGMGQSPKDVNLKQILSSRDLTINAFYDGKVSKASMLIPINIPELIRVIGKQAKEGGMGGGNHRSMGSVPPPGAFSISPGKVARGPLGQ